MATVDDQSDELTCETHGPYPVRVVPLFGGNVLRVTRCPKCSQADADRESAAAQAKADATRQERIESRMQQAGIPLRFRDRTLDSYKAETPGQQKALTVARRFAIDFKRHLTTGPTLVFSGSVGTGKTHLAIAIAQAAMAQGCTAMYENAMDIIRRLREGWRRDAAMSEAQALDLYGSLDLLVIDELGVQFGSDAEQLQLFDVLNRRYRDNKPTILLTNLNLDGVKTFLGERTYDRLRETGYFVMFDWNSYRGVARMEIA